MREPPSERALRAPAHEPTRRLVFQRVFCVPPGTDRPPPAARVEAGQPTDAGAHIPVAPARPRSRRRSLFCGTGAGQTPSAHATRSASRRRRVSLRPPLARRSRKKKIFLEMTQQKIFFFLLTVRLHDLEKLSRRVVSGRATRRRTRTLTMTLLAGRTSTWRLPRFSAAVMVRRASFKTEARTMLGFSAPRRQQNAKGKKKKKDFSRFLCRALPQHAGRIEWCGCVGFCHACSD